MRRHSHLPRVNAAALSALGAVVVATLIATLVAVAAPVSGAPATLQSTIADVARRWPDIGHISPAELDRLMARHAVVIFDVRTPAEYAVSHLPGAISVDPDMTSAAFLGRFGDRVKGKTAVFYCSVGVRSSRLAERVAKGLKGHGATSVDDLAGGIFAWHGDKRPLVDAKGPTDFVHPYDSSWGQLLTRPQLARTAPGG